MKEKRPHLITSELSNKNPVLIIDKKGIIGTYLANKLKEQFLVVLVSPARLASESVAGRGRQVSFHDNIIHVPYRKKVPIIPDNSYSHYFIFYNGETELLDMLASFVKKANLTKGKMFFLTSLEYSSPALFRRLANHAFYHIKIILHGEVFDGGTKIVNMVNYLIHSARTYKKVILPNEGVSKIYPVWIEDLLAVIIASAFSVENPLKHILAFPRTAFTEITVARILQKINPDLKIDFNKKRTKSPNYFIPTDAEYIFASYDLEIGLRQAMSHNSDLDLSNLDKDLSYKVPGSGFSLRRWYYVALAALIIPLIYILMTSLVGFGLMSLALPQAENGNFKTAENFASLANSVLGSAEAVAKSYLPLELLAKGPHDQLVKSLAQGADASEIEKDLFKSIDSFAHIYRGESRDPKADFNKALTTTKNSLIKLEEMKAQKELPASVAKKFENANYLLSIFENTIDSYPQILGFDKKRKYLLLFQNNMELRPGGGFIGSYATVGIDKGQIDKLEISDVYDADGKLRTHIEPPFALKRYGGVTHWFLRDSNFDVSTLSNAAASASILKQETGDQVDGVVSIDTNFIKNLLAATGPVSVDDYKEVVNADNFYILTQKHAEDNFFPGSTQKKDFLRSLLNSLLIKLSDKRSVSYLQVTKQIEKSIKEKHLLFVFENPSIQKSFSVNNLSGAALDNRPKGENAINDYFGVIDANIGANKSNYYLTRSISQEVAIADGGGVSAKATLNYENMSKPGDRFGGEYKNYIRFILPSGANLNSVSSDDRDNGITPAITNPTVYLDKTFALSKEIEIETSQINGKEVVGFFFSVPSGVHKKVSISYTVPQGIDTSSPVSSYNLRLFKQPGTDQDPYSFTLSYPAKLTPSSLGKEFVDLGGKVKYETNLNEDKDIKLKFSQK